MARIDLKSTVEELVGSKEENNTFNTLSCNSKLGKNDPRVSLIRKAIKDKNVKNIAVIGPYGSGKSSVISSYIDSKKINKRSLFFSIDTLKKYKENLDVEDKKTGENNNGEKDNNRVKRIKIVDAIYTELLKRNANSIVLDNFINHLFNGVKQLVLFILFLIASVCSCVLGSFYLFQFIGWWCILTGIGALSLLEFLYFTISLRTVKVQNRLLNGMDVVAEWEHVNSKITFEMIKNNPGRAENIIIKQLAAKRIRYIVFEDLDRLSENKYVEYVEEIKDFNYLINQNKSFKRNYRRIIFFYAIRDDLFLNSEARVKNFDLIVPVVPFSTSANAPDSVMLNSFIKDNVDQNAIVDLSSYLLDQRQVNAVITQFNVNRQTTYSNDLLTELFALTILNVRFPSVHAKLYKKQNFLSALIKEFEANHDLFKLFSDDGSKTLPEPSSLKELRSICSELKDGDGEELTLFLKTCINNRYITFNYETLLHSNIENGLFYGDIGYIHKFRASEYYNYYQIMNPLALLQHVKNPETMFALKNGINVYLLKYIFTTKNKFSGLENCQEVAVNSLNKMSNEEMANYVNGTNPQDYEDWYGLLSTIVPGSTQLYFAATKIGEKDKRHQICLKLFNIFDAKHFEANRKLPDDYINIVNSKEFIDAYGQQMIPGQTIKMVNANYFIPESLVNLKMDSTVISAFSTTLSFKKTFENMCIVYKDFSKQPLTIINSSEKLWNDLIKHKADLIILLNKCNPSETTDTSNSCLTFIEKAITSSNTDLLGSLYFDQWEHKLAISPSSSSKYLVSLKRGLIDFSNSNDIDTTRTIAQDTLLECIQKYINYFATIRFSASTSWFLVAKLDNESLHKLKDSLTLDNSVNYIASLGYSKINEIFDLLNDEEKNKLLKYVMANSPSSLVESYISDAVSVDDLKEIKINTVFIDAIFSKKAYKLLNICVINHNSDVAKQYMIQHPKLDYKDMFIRDNGELLKCEDVDLEIEYCKSEKRDFDFVRTLITSLSQEELSSSKNLRQFLESFEIKKENKDSKYLYFENNENNNAIIEHFNECGIVKNVKYLDNNSIIRCTMA